MGLSFSYREQLLHSPDESQRSFLVKELDQLFAALSMLGPLTDHIKMPYQRSAVLVTDSDGIPAFHQQVRASVYNSAVQAIPDATVTPLTFDTAVFDVGGMWNPVFPTRLTVPPIDGDGTYLVHGVIPYAANAAGQRQVRLNKNGVLLLPFDNTPAAAAFTQTCQMTILLPAIGGDYFTLDAYQDSGGALNTSARCQLTALKLAAP